MEILLEAVFELILEGSVEIGKSKKVPMPLRIAAVLVLAVITFGLAVVFLLGAVAFFQSGDLLIGFVFLAVEALWVGMLVSLFRRLYK